MVNQFDAVQLRRDLEALGLSPSKEAIEQLLCYGARLIEKNRVMNLTAITEPAEVAQLHFVDSAALLCHIKAEGRRLIDVGTGAGFPGLVLKVLEPGLSLTLLDSLEKRLHFLEEVCTELGLGDVQMLHGRAEEQAHMPELRDAFDFATARAVAPLPMLMELCLPYVKVGGSFWAMKAAKSTKEIKAAHEVGQLLRCGEPRHIGYCLPGSDIGRSLIEIQKREATPEGYPRKWAKMKSAWRRLEKSME